MKRDGYTLSENWTDYDYYAKQPLSTNSHGSSEWATFGLRVFMHLANDSKFDTNGKNDKGRALEEKVETNSSRYFSVEWTHEGKSDIPLCNPPERPVYGLIVADQSAGVYLFPPLGLMHIQAYIEKMSEYVVDILDGVVGNQDYPEYEENSSNTSDLVGISCFTP